MMSPTQPPHGRTVAMIITELTLWMRTGVGGEVGTEDGFILEKYPTTIRAPDVYYLSPATLAALRRDHGFYIGAPELAVEVVSPSETAADINDKVNDFLGAGTALIWVVYPNRQQIVQYTASGEGRIFQSTDVIRNQIVLPGLVLPVTAIFQP